MSAAAAEARAKWSSKISSPASSQTTKRCLYWDQDSGVPGRTTAGWQCGELYVCDDATHKLNLTRDTSAGLAKAMQNLEQHSFWQGKDAIKAELKSYDTEFLGLWEAAQGGVGYKVTPSAQTALTSHEQNHYALMSKSSLTPAERAVSEVEGLRGRVRDEAFKLRPETNTLTAYAKIRCNCSTASTA